MEIRKETEDAIEEISSAWHKSIASILETAQLIYKHSNSSNWKAIQHELAKRNIMKSSVISMMLSIAQNNALNNYKNRNFLPPSYNTLYHISQLSEDVIESRINQGDITSSVKLDEVRAWKSKGNITGNIMKIKDITLIKVNGDDFNTHKAELSAAIIQLKTKFSFLKVEGV